MLLLPRKPLEAHASIYCGSPAEAVHDYTQYLLEASTTRRPYAGLIIREALRTTELKAFQNRDEAAIKAAQFLKPVNAAMQAWWKQQPQSEYLHVEDLAYSHTVRSGVGEHHDQYISRDMKGRPRPMQSPLTVIATAEGTADYYLEVMKKDVFDEADLDDINSRTIPLLDSPLTSKLSFTTGPGDVVIFTNAPPTLHAVEASENNRFAVVYQSITTELQ